MTGITRALVLGRSEHTWDEMQAAKELAPFDMIIATKRAGRDYDGPVHHWVSCHPQLFAPWAQERAAAGRPPAGQLWAGIFKKQRVRGRFPLEINWIDSVGGSSGLLAVQVGPHLEVDKIVLCGVPMQQSVRYDDDRPWREALVYRNAWLELEPEMRGRVRSMAGWTQELLGPVTKDWLYAPRTKDQQAGTGTG